MPATPPYDAATTSPAPRAPARLRPAALRRRRVGTIGERPRRRRRCSSRAPRAPRRARSRPQRPFDAGRPARCVGPTTGPSRCAPSTTTISPAGDCARRASTSGRSSQLLRAAVARRLARREDDRRDTAHQLSATVTVEMTTGSDRHLGGGVAELTDRVDDVLALSHLADDRVLGRQADVVAGDDEELASRRSRRLVRCLCHRHDSPRVGGVRGWSGRPSCTRDLPSPTRSGRRPGSRSRARCGGRPCRRRSRPGRARRARRPSSGPPPDRA